MTDVDGQSGVREDKAAVSGSVVDGSAVDDEEGAVMPWADSVSGRRCDAYKTHDAWSRQAFFAAGGLDL